MAIRSMNQITAAEKRQLDNMVNKINKRLEAAAKVSPDSNTFQALETELSKIEHAVIQSQLPGGKMPAAGYAAVPGVESPIIYKTVNGVSVPQIRRSRWALEYLSKMPNLQDALSVGTIQQENFLVESAAMASNPALQRGDMTAQDFAKLYEDRATQRGIYDLVWTFAYNNQSIPEFGRFLASARGRSSDTNSREALELYLKYSRMENVNKPTAPKEKYLSAKSKAEIKSGKTAAENAFYDAYNRGSYLPELYRLAAEALKYTGEGIYTDFLGNTVLHDPTPEEITKFLSDKGIRV